MSIFRFFLPNNAPKPPPNWNFLLYASSGITFAGIATFSILNSTVRENMKNITSDDLDGIAGEPPMDSPKP